MKLKIYAKTFFLLLPILINYHYKLTYNDNIFITYLEQFYRNTITNFICDFFSVTLRISVGSHESVKGYDQGMLSRKLLKKLSNLVHFKINFSYTIYVKTYFY